MEQNSLRQWKTLPKTDWGVFLVIACKFLLPAWLKQPEERKKRSTELSWAWPDRRLRQSSWMRKAGGKASWQRRGQPSAFPTYLASFAALSWADLRPFWPPVPAICLHLRLALGGLRGNPGGAWSWKYTQKGHCIWPLFNLCRLHLGWIRWALSYKGPDFACFQGSWDLQTSEIWIGSKLLRYGMSRVLGEPGLR